MSDYGSQSREYRERDDRRDAVPDSPEGAEPGAGHQGTAETVGVDAVLHSGDRGVDWDRQHRATSLDEWGFQRGERE